MSGKLFVDNAKVLRSERVEFEKGSILSLRVVWHEKEKGKDKFSSIFMPLTVLSPGSMKIGVGDKINFRFATLKMNESDKWVTGKKGDKSTVKPAVFPNLSVWAKAKDGTENIEVIERADPTTQTGKKSPFPITDNDDEDDLPF